MEKVRYMISDAAQIAGVETHVLRYWEDELDLTIPRNEMGHRYYTRKNIDEFLKIKELKEQGYQLKAIRALLHNEEESDIKMTTPAAKQELQRISKPELVPHQAKPEPVAEASSRGLSAEERMAQFRELMSDIVGHAISQNNEELSLVIGQEVQERVLKEMNYLAREQEDAADERFKKLDAAIRGELRKKKVFFAKDNKKVNEAKASSKREKKFGHPKEAYNQG